MLAFYWPNIIAGCVLVFLLSLVGKHLVARNQSVETMLVGQEFQTAILLSSICVSFFETNEHNDHAFHIEALLSLILVICFHIFFLKLNRIHRKFRTEGAIVAILLLMGLNHLIVLFSPIVEFHMVKSLLGDIVTVSKNESFLVIILSTFIFFLFYKNSKNIMLDTMEISLFNNVTKKRSSLLYFNLIIIFLMLLSIHLFGSLFTVGVLIIPAFISGALNVSNKDYLKLALLNIIGVFIAFGLMFIQDRLPTTVLILFSVFLISLFYSFFRRN
ncbi:MAG: hypothetical protein N4A33_07635 [Bacteriovoracaceae bacterium]|jgi:ABC-type Mn2+/Zn2+ transport system permease subunit|nr:hypothetical protein [Bacteriovoracaceae bacterium]